MSKYAHVNNNGFSIIELIIAIAVIAILVAILIPSFAGLMESAREKAVINDVRNILIAVEAFAAQGKTFGENDYVDSNIVTPSKIMAYLGKATGGQLTIENSGDFTYKKLEGNKLYIASYSFSTGEISISSTDDIENLNITEIKPNIE